MKASGLYAVSLAAALISFGCSGTRSDDAGARGDAFRSDGAEADASIGDGSSGDAQPGADARAPEDAFRSDGSPASPDAGDGAISSDAGDGMVPSDTGADASRAIDTGPIDASSASARITMVRATSGPLASPIHIDTVQITYVLPPIGDDPGGVFVQSDLEGPALFMAIDPATLSPPPVVGAYGGFSVTATAIVEGQHRVTEILPGSWFSGTTPVGGVVAEPQGLRAIAVPSQIDELESELTVNELDQVDDFVACGLDHYCARVTSAGVLAATSNYRFRTTQSLASQLGLGRRCHIVLGEYPDMLAAPTPLWRRGSEANPMAVRPGEITGAACPLVRAIAAYATSANAVSVVFDAPIDPSTVAASDFTWTGGITTASATVSSSSPYLVSLTTSTIASGSTPTVSVSGIRDALGIDVLPGTFATFTARDSGAAPNAAGQIVITEIMHDPIGSEPAGEWIELFNPGGAPALLTGCTLAGSSGAGYTIASLTIAGGARVVLSSGADPGFAEDQNYGGAIRLEASGSLTLRCGETVIDRVEWSPGFQAAAGHSLSLDPQHTAAALNDPAIAWCVASSAYGAERGTPGMPNDDCR